MNQKIIICILVLISICLTLKFCYSYRQNFSELDLQPMSDIEKNIFMNNFFKYNEQPKLLRNEIKVKRFPKSRKIVIEDLTRVKNINSYKFNKNFYLSDNKITYKLKDLENTTTLKSGMLVTNSFEVKKNIKKYGFVLKFDPLLTEQNNLGEFTIDFTQNHSMALKKMDRIPKIVNGPAYKNLDRKTVHLFTKRTAPPDLQPYFITGTHGSDIKVLIRFLNSKNIDYLKEFPNERFNIVDNSLNPILTYCKLNNPYCGVNLPISQNIKGRDGFIAGKMDYGLNEYAVLNSPEYQKFIQDRKDSMLTEREILKDLEIEEIENKFKKLTQEDKNNFYDTLTPYQLEIIKTKKNAFYQILVELKTSLIIKKIKDAQFDLSIQDKEFIKKHKLQETNPELAEVLAKLAPSVSKEKSSETKSSETKSSETKSSKVSSDKSSSRTSSSLDGTYQDGDIFHIYVQDKKSNSKKAYYSISSSSPDTDKEIVSPDNDKTNAIFFKFTKFNNSEKSFFEVVDKDGNSKIAGNYRYLNYYIIYENVRKMIRKRKRTILKTTRKIRLRNVTSLPNCASRSCRYFFPRDNNQIDNSTKFNRIIKKGKKYAEIELDRYTQAVGFPDGENYSIYLEFYSRAKIDGFTGQMGPKSQGRGRNTYSYYTYLNNEKFFYKYEPSIKKLDYTEIKRNTQEQIYIDYQPPNEIKKKFFLTEVNDNNLVWKTDKYKMIWTYLNNWSWKNENDKEEADYIIDLNCISFVDKVTLDYLINDTRIYSLGKNCKLEVETSLDNKNFEKGSSYYLKSLPGRNINKYYSKSLFSQVVNIKKELKYIKFKFKTQVKGIKINLFNANFHLPNYLFAPRVALFMKTNYPEFKISINSSEVEVINTLDTIDHSKLPKINKDDDNRNKINLSLEADNTHKIKLYKKNNVVDIINTNSENMKCKILDFEKPVDLIQEFQGDQGAFHKTGDEEKTQFGSKEHPCSKEQVIKDLNERDNIIKLYLPTSILENDDLLFKIHLREDIKATMQLEMIKDITTTEPAEEAPAPEPAEEAPAPEPAEEEEAEITKLDIEDAKGKIAIVIEPEDLTNLPNNLDNLNQLADKASKQFQDDTKYRKYIEDIKNNITLIKNALNDYNTAIVAEKAEKKTLLNEAIGSLATLFFIDDGDRFTGTLNQNVPKHYIILNPSDANAIVRSPASGQEFKQFTIKISDYVNTEKQKDLLKAYDKILLHYNPYDIFNTHISKIKKIDPTPDNITIYKYIKKKFLTENNLKVNDKFPDLYLNEHCNISILGCDLQEYIFNYKKNNITQAMPNSVCPLLTNNCKLKVSKGGNTGDYNLQVVSSLCNPNNPAEKALCSNPKVNPLVEAFANEKECTDCTIIKSEGRIVNVDGKETTCKVGEPCPSETEETEKVCCPNDDAAIQELTKKINSLSSQMGKTSGATSSGGQQSAGSNNRQNGAANNKQTGGSNSLGPAGSISSGETDMTENGGTGASNATNSQQTSVTTVSADGINKELMTIINQITQGYINFSNKQVVQNKLDNLETMIKKLEHKDSSSDTTFLKKLLVASQLQMNNALNKLAHQPRNYLENPSLPGITQFKPSGASNIFSPLIDIRTHDSQDEAKFSKAYEKGFKEAMGERSGSSSHSSSGMASSHSSTYNYIDDDSRKSQFIQDSSKTNIIGKTNMQSTSVTTQDGDRTSINLNTGQKAPEQHNADATPTSQSTHQLSSENGYARQDNNGKLGMPGYSYLEPRFFNVPQQRTPVCHQPHTTGRGKSSLEPAGYLSSGNSNVMEFHEVGSILPKFTYQEQTNSKTDSTNRY